MRILLAEDNSQLSHVIVAALQTSQYTVDAVANGQKAVEYAKQHPYDVIILDIMMPVKSGLEALREIRSSGDRTYVIMLTALSEVTDKVNGLDAGADDYLTKPFSLKELLARLRSLERRFDSLDEDVLKFGNVTLDGNEQVLKSENSISLSSKESRLLQYLILNAGKELSSQTLLNQTWDDDDEHADNEDVWINVSYLRQKLRAVNANVLLNGPKGGPYQLVKQENEHD
ncbi:MAG: response regulator transcription factor [Limosilactobacillus sp.]